MAAKKQSSGKATKKAKAGTRAKKASARKPRRETKPKRKKRKRRKNRAGRGGTTGLDKSVEQFRESLEHSVTLSRDRLQEVVDDAVKRGRMTRGDAEKMLSDLIKTRPPADRLRC